MPEGEDDADGEDGSRVTMMNGLVSAAYSGSVPTVCMCMFVCMGGLLMGGAVIDLVYLWILGGGGGGGGRGGGEGGLKQ